MFVRLVNSDESTAKLTKVKPKHLQKIEDAPDSQVAARDDGHAIEAVLNEFVGDTAPTGPIFAETARRSALQAGDASADNTAQEVARSIVEEVVSSAIDRVAAEPAVAEAVDEVVRAGETSETAAQSIDADEGGQAEFQIPRATTSRATTALSRHGTWRCAAASDRATGRQLPTRRLRLCDTPSPSRPARDAARAALRLATRRSGMLCFHPSCANVCVRARASPTRVTPVAGCHLTRSG